MSGLFGRRSSIQVWDGFCAPNRIWSDRRWESEGRFGLQFRRRRSPSACLSCCSRLPGQAHSPNLGEYHAVLIILLTRAPRSRWTLPDSSGATVFNDCPPGPVTCCLGIRYYRLWRKPRTPDMRLFMDPAGQPSPLLWIGRIRACAEGRVLGSQGRAAAPGVRPMMPSSVAFFSSCATVHAYVRTKCTKLASPLGFVRTSNDPACPERTSAAWLVPFPLHRASNTRPWSVSVAGIDIARNALCFRRNFWRPVQGASRRL